MSGPSEGSHVVLVGLMGAGKTTVGASCAEALGRPFVDTDQLVETATGRTVAEIFGEDGEPAFRALERTAVADACASPTPLVIACGGGSVLDAENRAVIARAGLVVWLRASPEQLAARIGSGDERPLLSARALVETLERLEHLRAGAYQAVADVAVDTDGLDPDAVTARVVAEVERCAA